jgi:Putative  PD-(D/E)XK family member, (DUF4420)
VTLTEDPWRHIVPPSASELVNAKRVDADLPWGFFWARDVDGRCLLLLTHEPESAPTGHLPHLKGIDLVVRAGDGQSPPLLVFKLLDSSHRDIFLRLCVDIVTSTSKATSEKEAVEIACTRTWRWHHLLRGGSDGKLTAEEQKGLIGELLVLERHLLTNFGPADALASWRGPLHAPKDFEMGRVCVEAKARRGAARPYVAISSEFQLDDAGVDVLFLHVVELDRSPANTADGFSLATVAGRVRDAVESEGDGSLDVLETLLVAAGFRWEDDYSDSVWVEGTSRIYRVDDGFPRLTAKDIPTGIGEVKYALFLPYCEPFEVASDVLTAELKAGQDVD